MLVKVYLSPYFADIAGKQGIIEIEGATVGEAIINIEKIYPGFKNEIVDGSGKIYGFIEIYINGESAFPNELSKPLKNGDEVAFITMVGGG
jgi:molybdopterin converting factor small subunit